MPRDSGGVNIDFKIKIGSYSLAPIMKKVCSNKEV
nr:MAG TPA: hypothetical protein [Caudoviricetes sp.]